MLYENTSDAVICIGTLRSKLNGKVFRLAPGEKAEVVPPGYDLRDISRAQPILDRYVRLGELNGVPKKKKEKSQKVYRRIRSVPTEDVEIELESD